MPLLYLNSYYYYFILLRSYIILLKILLENLFIFMLFGKNIL